ncbi:MAG: dihydropteroate synthase [Muribaculaceae bacterium]|nr:dihydropteroate synthase [Muribaculaceae bacterium]
MTLSNFKTYTLSMRGNQIEISHPWIMGILNVTPDSFFAGSRASTDADIETRVTQLIAEGADIIDIGACSTRPGAEIVPEHEEIARLRQAVAIVRRLLPDTYISIDTCSALVAQVAIEEMGADIINDVSGGTIDLAMPATVARLGVPAVVMHMRGVPATMQQFTQYDNVVKDVVEELRQHLDTWRQAGATQLISDPGFGFSKTITQNYELMAHLDAFHALDVPLLVGISRKSMIYKSLGCSPDEALNGTTVLNTVALLAGAHILRVHDVKAAVEARKLVSLLNSKPTQQS